MGESAHGLGKFVSQPPRSTQLPTTPNTDADWQCGLHAGYAPVLPDEGGRRPLRREARCVYATTLPVTPTHPDYAGWDYYMYATSLLLPSLLWDSHHSPTVLRPRSPAFLRRIMRRTSCTSLPSSVFSVRSSFNTLLSLRNSSRPLLHNEVREVIAVWIE